MLWLNGVVKINKDSSSQSS